MPGSFLDSNVVLSIAGADPAKAGRAEALLAEGGVISVQVLNEISNVARRKMGLDWPETHARLAAVRGLPDGVPGPIDFPEGGNRKVGGGGKRVSVLVDLG